MLPVLFMYKGIRLDDILCSLVKIWLQYELCIGIIKAIGIPRDAPIQDV